MHVGQQVKFAAPTDASEATVRFTVAELRGERVLVELVCDMPIRPTFVYPASDLTLVD